MTEEPLSPRAIPVAAISERRVRWVVVTAVAAFIVVLITQFTSSWNTAEAARASALAAWAQGDSARAAAVERHRACGNGHDIGAITVDDCAQRTGSAELRTLVDLATKQASAYTPAPLSWFVH